DCYYALISSGIDLVALGVDINQAKQWSKANLKIEVETLLDTSTVTDSGVFIPTLKTQIGTLTDTSVTNLTPGRPIVNMSQITGNKIVGTLTDTSMTNLTPGRPIVNVSQITGSKIGGGSFGSTYLDKNSNVLTKIFFDPDLPGNASQISFYQQYGNAPLVQGYMGDVVDESGKVIGFQQKYIPNTVSLGEYLSRGGTFTQGSVDEVVNNLALNQSITGQAHGDLVRPDNILNWQGDRGWPGYIHPGNVLVEILPDGSPKIHIIDWNGYNTFTEPLSSPDVMQLELETIKNGLQQFVP
ncbi:MAG: hypothetical protein PHR98_02795, partial [Candidatus Shapirobacteria bacterium]|nr:hypothetical protein [Candidatus Shapirobacteria bacterium]